MDDNGESGGWAADDVARAAAWGLVVVLVVIASILVWWWGVSQPPVDNYLPVVVQAVGPLALVGATVALLYVNRDLAKSSQAMNSLQERIVERDAPVLRCKDARIVREDGDAKLVLELENSGESPSSLESIEFGRFEKVSSDEPDHVKAGGVVTMLELVRFTQTHIQRGDVFSDLRLTTDERAVFKVDLPGGVFEPPEEVVGYWARVHGTEESVVHTPVPVPD